MRPLGAVLVLVIVGGLAAPSGAAAQTPADQLDAESADTIREALELMALSGDPSNVPHVVARIRRGLPEPVLLSAVETLGLIGHGSAGPVLVELVRHRRPRVRAAAAQAAAACHADGAVDALIRALGDLDPSVRAAAAGGLGQLGDQAAVPRLFQALDRNVIEASPALGQLVSGDDVGRYSEYLQRLPLDVMVPGLNELFARDDVTTRQKLNLVAQLQEMGTGAVREYLESLADTMPESGRDAPVRTAAMDAAMRIAG